MPTDFSALDFERLAARYQSALIEGAIDLAAAAAIVVFGLWAASALAGAVRRLSKRNRRVDDTLAAFLSSTARYAVIAVVAIAALQRLGVATTSIVAMLGAATLAIGLALQGALGNVAAGVMLIAFRPYRLGDWVEIGGRAGEVRDITLFTTELATIDNVKLVLPNSQCWGAPIANYSAHPIRRLELRFSVAYSSDLDRARAALKEAIAANPLALVEPAPVIELDALGDYAVTILVRVSCRNADVVALRFALLRAGKEALDRAGVEIPFPTSVTLHIDKTSETPN